MLAQQQRDMTAGRIPFVTMQGSRLAVTTEAMEHFALESGQTIDGAIFDAILRFNIARCREKLGEAVDEHTYLSGSDEWPKQIDTKEV